MEIFFWQQVLEVVIVVVVVVVVYDQVFVGWYGLLILVMWVVGFQYGVGMVWQVFYQQCVVVVLVEVVCVDVFVVVFDWFVIEDQFIVLEGDFVFWYVDDVFDEVFVFGWVGVGMVWEVEYYYVVMFGFVQWNDFGVVQWQVQIVGEFVDQDEIVDQQVGYY